MCDDLVTVGDKRICREYPIEILFCATCITAHQRYQVPKEDLFPSSYHYRSRFTADVLNGMKGLAASCEQRYGSMEGKTVLDIGCNDGSLLDFFKQRGARTIGIEPTEACRDAQEKGHTAYNHYLSAEVSRQIVAAHGQPDIITFTNVFAHIEDLQGVVDSLKLLIAPQTVIVIENHYLGAVLDGSQFDTFYHEHPRTYSYTSFVHIAKSLGVTLVAAEFPARYGGNIRVFMGGVDAQTPASQAADLAALRERETHFHDAFGLLREKIGVWRAKKRHQIQEQVTQGGPLSAKAFPGRAAILVKLLGLDEGLVPVVYEKPGSLKIGHYLPGTRIPIRSDDELFALAAKPKALLNLAWHIPKEIHAYLRENGYDGPIIDVIRPEDLLNHATAGKPVS
jgi:hypothetical protein